VISNACKPAFPGEWQGEIAIRVAEADGQLRLQIRDNGIGFMPEQGHPSWSMGQRLITNFVQQLNGTSRFAGENGTRFELMFPHVKHTTLRA